MTRPPKRTGTFSTGTRLAERWGAGSCPWVIVPCVERTRPSAAERRLAQRLATRSSLDQGGAVVGPDLAEDDQLGPVPGVAGVRGRARAPAAGGRRRTGRPAPPTTRAAAGGARARRRRGRCAVGQLGRGGVTAGPARRPGRSRRRPLRPAPGVARGPGGPCGPGGAGSPGAGRPRPRPAGPGRSSARSATWPRRWASEAVVKGTPRAAKRASRGSAPGTARPPACASRPRTARPPCRRRPAASAMRSHHSVGAVGPAAGHLDEVGVGQHVAGPGGRQLLDGRGVGVPAASTDARRPLGHRDRVAQVVEAPRPDPVDRAEEHVEGVAGRAASATSSIRPR